MSNDQMTLTVEELGKLLGVSRVTAYQLANTNGFPSIRVGRRILILRKQLEIWLENRMNGDILAG